MVKNKGNIMAIPSQIVLKNQDNKDPNTKTAYIEPLTTFRFPLLIDSGIGVDSGPFMLISFFEYERKINDQTKARKKFSVYLPMPANIGQNHGAGFNAIQTDFIMDKILENSPISGDIADSIIGLGATMAARTGEMALGGRFPAYYNVKSTLQGQAGDTLSNVFGLIVNPRQELKYSGPDLRRHSFEYLILPKNAKESNMVRQMIEKIEDAMYPTFQDEYKVFLNYPMEAVIDFYDADGKKVNGVLPIPDSFLENFNVTINPQGASARLFDDGSPTGYRLSFSFAESNQLTRESLQALRTR